MLVRDVVTSPPCSVAWRVSGSSSVIRSKRSLGLRAHSQWEAGRTQSGSQLRKDNEKLRVVKRILSDENGAYILPHATSSCPSGARSELSQVQPAAGVEHNVVPSQFLTPHVRKHGIMTRHRRSRSAGNSKDMWLDHRPGIPASLPTVMQPQMKKRKSITKLTDAKDVTGSKASKYCLMTQEQDSAGELETRLYKADVVPTSGGGAQVIFNDLETLKQRSPLSPGANKRSAEEGTVEHSERHARCHISLEGHSKRPRV
uniref:Kinesin-like protein Kif23 Arf6-interacting domain-containing protein n=1 Tax=Timema bartmani TaxID=61472 RepID=A0A7R9I613_9NEOP|nr:unnamed protein product [Timema bartmani]